MKITLRKVKSLPVGNPYTRELFTPLALEPFVSTISITGNLSGAQFSNIISKYSLYGTRGAYYNKIRAACISGRADRKVVKVYGFKNIIIVPKTFSSNKKTIKKYSNEICTNIIYTRYLHFTHFGFLKNKFPKNQIEIILSVFLTQTQKINCEICWDIDEKFYEKMENLLESTLLKNNLNTDFEMYSEVNFRWSEDYRFFCDERERESQEIERLIARRDNAVQFTPNRTNNHNVLRRNDMATIQPEEMPNIGAVAAGNAGEYYAISLFIRMGFLTGKAPEGTATYDLLVMSTDRLSFKPVQVKTITNGQHWLLRRRHEEVVENLIFCFIKLTDINSIPKVYLLPAHVVSDVIKMCHAIYLAIPNQLGGRHADTELRTLKFDFSTLIANVDNPAQYLTVNQLKFIRLHSLGWLDQYEHNFDVFSP